MKVSMSYLTASFLLSFFSFNALGSETIRLHPYGSAFCEICVVVENPVGSTRADLPFFIGYGNRADNHGPLFQKLAKAGTRVISFDYPSHGETKCGHLDNANFTVLRDYTERIEEATREDRNRPLFVAGWSTGGLLARHKDSETALILGERTNGAGCGYINGGISTTLPHSKLKVRVPDCVRFLAGGENEVGGIQPNVEMNMKDMASEAFVHSLKDAISNAYEHKRRRLKFTIGLQSGGLPQSVWAKAIKNRVKLARWNQIITTKKPMTPTEREWLNKIKDKAGKWWQVDVLKLNQPFLPTVTPPSLVEIVFGNQGGDDGFTGDGPLIYVDLSSWVANYGSPNSDGAGLRIRRILSHEYTHLLTKALARSQKWLVDSVLEQALWEMFHEGLGNYHSLSGRWVTPKGILSAHANETLDRLVPTLVDRLTGIKNTATEVEAKSLMKGLSAGPFDQKWGALPVALWLRQEAKGNYGSLSGWIKKGPAGIRELLQNHLPAPLKSQVENL